MKVFAILLLVSASNGVILLKSKNEQAKEDAEAELRKPFFQQPAFDHLIDPRWIDKDSAYNENFGGEEPKEKKT